MYALVVLSYEGIFVQRGAVRYSRRHFFIAGRCGGGVALSSRTNQERAKDKVKKHRPLRNPAASSKFTISSVRQVSI